MEATWVSLLPPLLVIAVILFTQQLNISLAVGILCAGLIAGQGNIVVALRLCIEKFITHITDVDNIYLYVVLVFISSLIVLLTITGSAAGCARIIGKKIRTKRSVEVSSVLLAFLLSIDDYLSILTVGFVMKPIADRLAVARTKLAYIMHALAGPLVIIMPISTWAAAVLVQFDNAGIGNHATSKIIGDVFYVYLKTVPFIFYSLILVLAVCFVVWRRISFGVLAQDERKAVVMVDEGEERSGLVKPYKHSLVEITMPIGLLVGGVFFGILYAGNYSLFGGNNSLIDAFRENDKTFLIFFLSGCAAFVSTVILALYKKMICFQQIPAIVWEGFLSMKSSITMVIFASMLGSFLRLDLHTGSYVAYLLLGAMPLFLIPVMVFIVSLAITSATGSAWGTFSLLIPIVTEMLLSLLQLRTPIVLDAIPLLFPTLGALLSGAACGNHISPLADTTVLTATSAGVEPLEHARTQFAYAVPVVLGTVVAFVMSGLLCNNGLYMSFFAPLVVGVLVCLVLLVMGNKFFKKHE